MLFSWPLQGMYCPTTCGVADYMLKYFSITNDGLEQMQTDLENIANMTQDAENRVVYIKDSVTASQKSITPGNTTNMNTLETSGGPKNINNPLLQLSCTDITADAAYFFPQTFISKSHRACWMMSFDLKRLFLCKSSK